MQPLNASSIMDPAPTVLHPTDPIRLAVEQVMKHRYRSIPVTDEDCRYLGVFGINCLLKLVLPKAAVMDQGLTSLSFTDENLGDLHRRLQRMEDQPISVCMKRDVRTVEPDTTLLETILVLYTDRTSVPVVDPKTQKLLGMVSYWDLGEKVLAAEATQDPED